MQKSSYHLVDPELRAFIDAMPTDGELTRDALPARRDAYNGAIPTTPLPDGVTERDVWIDGPAGPGKLRLYILENKNQTGPVPLLYDIHGGGYIMGVP